MGQLNNRPNTGATSGDAEPRLKSVTQDSLAQLSEDVGRLQSEKSRLIGEIESLRAQRRSIQPPAAKPTDDIAPQPLRDRAVLQGKLREPLPVLPGDSRSPASKMHSVGKDLFWNSEQSKFRVGLLMVLLSTVALSLHNVAVNIIGNKSQIFGLFETGGFIHLTSLGNALLILWTRMLVVVPLMISIAKFLYPPIWTDIRTFLQFKDRVLLWTAIGSGFFLFLSQVLIYTAISKVGPGVAVTILFMYPLVTVPLAWLLFKDQAQHSKALQIGVMVTILLGVILTAFPKLASTTNISWLGIGAAILSGIAFAFYLIFMQISFGRKLNGFRLSPVPLSLIQFLTIFVFTSLSLIIRPAGLEVEVLPEGRPGLVVGGIVLGVLTLAGYLLNNFGVRMMGAAQASILASIGPVLTALLAFIIIPGPRSALAAVQWLGILVVTVGVLALAFERLFLQAKAAKPVG